MSLIRKLKYDYLIVFFFAYLYFPARIGGFKSGGSVGAQSDQRDFTGVFVGNPSGLQEARRQSRGSKVKQLVDLKDHQPGSRRETSSRRSPSCSTRWVVRRKVMKESWHCPADLRSELLVLTQNRLKVFIKSTLHAVCFPEYKVKCFLMLSRWFSELWIIIICIIILFIEIKPTYIKKKHIFLLDLNMSFFHGKKWSKLHI